MPSCPSDRAERAASAEKRCTIAKCRWSASPWALASMSSAFATIVILAADREFTGIAFALFQFRRFARIRLNDTAFSETANLNDGDGSEDKMAKLIEIYEAIRQGADSFLFAEYKICAVFLVAFGFLVLILCSRTSENGEVAWQWTSGVLTSISFCAGGVTSIVSGYIGMKVRRQRSRVLAVLAAAALYRSRTAQVAVFSNARTTVSAMMPDPWKESFNTAFRAGSVMGFSLCGIGLLSLYLICNVYTLSFDWTKSESCKLMFECVSGFGLGGSAIALFGRVGGGIYIKAADVGADLAGKVVENIPEDDPRNPASWYGLRQTANCGPRRNSKHLARVLVQRDHQEPARDVGHEAGDPSSAHVSQSAISHWCVQDASVVVVRSGCHQFEEGVNTAPGRHNSSGTAIAVPTSLNSSDRPAPDQARPQSLRCNHDGSYRPRHA